jgi:hypothetical protein
MNSIATWDCPICSKAEKPRFNTVTEFDSPGFDIEWLETQTTIYSCNRCSWAYERVYNRKTKITTDYEITFGEKGEVIRKEVQRF